MSGKALWVALEAKPGKEAEVEKFLQAGQALVEAELVRHWWRPSRKRCHGLPLKLDRPVTGFSTPSQMSLAGMRI